mgnify:CR=1 FL=1
MAKKAAKNLVIVESPAKAKTIGKYLGPDYEVMASMGHLRDLPKSKIGIDFENDFKPDYRAIRGKEDIIKSLKKAADKADMVYLATDPDREGEAISWHLKYLLDLDDAKTRRVTFNEITKSAVKASIKQARDIDMNLVDEQQARRCLSEENFQAFRRDQIIFYGKLLSIFGLPVDSIDPRLFGNLALSMMMVHKAIPDTMPFLFPEVAEDMVDFQVRALVDEMERVKEHVR